LPAGTRERTLRPVIAIQVTPHARAHVLVLPVGTPAPLPLLGPHFPVLPWPAVLPCLAFPPFLRLVHRFIPVIPARISLGRIPVVVALRPGIQASHAEHQRQYHQGLFHRSLSFVLTVYATTLRQATLRQH
jgi:hypothetical protein